MDYPAHQTYRRLYARYFQGNRTQQLVEAAGPIEGLTVADLAGGGGRLSLEVLKKKPARVYLVDESPDMIEEAPSEVLVRIRPIGQWLSEKTPQTIDLAFCQQAVNYWLTPQTAKSLASALKSGGTFVFNTFNRKPSAIPSTKEYELYGSRYVEVSWLTPDNMVQHVQVCEGMAPHTTAFRWISQDEFLEMLTPWFNLSVRNDGPTAVWVCVRRAD